MTWIRVVLVPLVALLMFFRLYEITTIVFLLAAFTDALDGSLARTRNQVTKFGMLFDPFADKLLIGVMVLFLVFQNYDWKLGVAVIGVEIIIIVTALIADIKFNTIRAANMWGKVKMIMQVLAVFLTLSALIWESPGLLSVAAWIFGVAVGFAVMSLFSHGI
jgi:CDP-diacylglycerol--glycerol-3-phosphate 3-phosphatidyltransferase